MMTQLKLFILSAIFFAYLFLAQHEVSAQEYKVRSYIVIPANFDTAEIENKLPQYKNSILQALKSIQSWYAEKLSGHTFRFVEDIEVVRTKKTTFNTYSTLMMYEELEGDKLVPWQRGTIKTVWMIGSTDMSEWGLHGDDEGRTWLSHWLLTQLSSASPGSRNRALGTLAHELGHAFGLVKSGYARGHPCTINYPYECIDIAPRPLPDTDEEVGSVMSYGGYPFYPNTGFNNSIYNPEKWKLYQIAFINPNHDQAPKRQPASRGTPSLMFNPYVIKPGIELSINLDDYKDSFGPPGTIEMRLKQPSTVFKLKTLQWTNKLIKVQIPDDIIPDNTQTTFQLKVLSGNREFTGTGFLQGRQKKRTTITVNTSVTCENNQPVSGLKVNLFLRGGSSFPSQLIGSSITNQEGRAVILITDPEFGTYEVALESPPKVSPDIPVEKFSVGKFSVGQDDNQTEFAFEYNYAQCFLPITQNPIVTPLPISTPSDTSSVTAIPNHTSEEQTTGIEGEDNHPQQVIISSSDDFIQRQDPQGKNITKTEVIDNPEEIEQIVWTPPETGANNNAFIRVIETDGDVKDYSAKLEDGDSTEIGGVKIVAKIPKAVQEIDLVPIGDESSKIVLYTIADGYQNPEIELRNDLNLFKIVTFYNDGSQEDSFFYIEKAHTINIMGSCVEDNNLGRKVVVPTGGTPFDCAVQNQVCKEFTNDEGKQDAHCVNPPEDGQ